MSENGHVNKFKKWAARAVPDGPMPDGDLSQAFGASQVVLLAVDDEGRIWQIENAKFSGGTVRTLANPRHEVIRLMDLFGVPQESEEPPVLDER